MKSVVIQQPNELVIEERPLPVPGAGEVRVKITLAGSAVRTATSTAAITRLRSIRASSAMSFLA
jgi:Zn-dependent alcohol dehydrogenase